MTLFVVPARRLGIADDLLSKALGAGFSRGGTGDPRAQHLYLKRQFIGFKDGRRIFRYWYADDLIKDRAEKAAVGTGLDEHFSTNDIHKLFEHLAKNRVKPSEVNEATLMRMLNVEDAKVVVRASFASKHQAPFLTEEREKAKTDPDWEPPRYPLQRLYTAFAALPDSVRPLLAETLRFVELANRTDPDIEAEAKKKGKTPPAGFYRFSDGGVRLLASGDGKFGTRDQDGGMGTFTEARGAWPRFGSEFTITEEIVWHELGHAVHHAFMKGTDAQKKVWNEWQQLEGMKSGGGREDIEAARISDYAYTNSMEDWAETFACMLSQPKQLAIQCPKRYEFMRKHVVPGPSVEEILATPDDDLAWWDTKPKTKAGKLLTASLIREGSPGFATTYQSDKDQFYSVFYKGRSVFFRVGPDDKKTEAGWARMPETLDPETGLPVYDVNASMRFKAKGDYKEIFDENGRALTNEQALLYLRQNDDDFNKKLSDDPSAVSHKTLAYQIYLALGESTGSQAEERERVKEARSVDAATLLKRAEAKLKTDTKKGKKADESDEDFESRLAETRSLIASLTSGVVADQAVLARHEFAPHEMTKEEYERLTPTFKFTKISAAAEQPHVRRAYDKASKKWVPKVAIDPVSGKETALLTAKVYEMPNPDGTKSVIKVNTTEPFEVGQSILVPQTRSAKTKAGVAHFEQTWVKYRIQGDGLLVPLEKRISYSTDKNGKRVRAENAWPSIRYTSTDAVKLSRDIGISLDTLLEKNGRYAAGQIMDPLLASLINPGGTRIRNEGDLAELMRQAAKVRSTSWLTVKGDSDRPDNPTYAHVKVTFDGGGNPLINGEYWNRQLGLSYGNNARMDALLDVEGGFKLEAVRDAKPRVLEFEEGAPARYRDPNTGKIIFGAIVKIDEERNDDGALTGKKLFVLTPIKGQGTHFTKRVTMREEDLEHATSAIDVKNIRRKRRDVLPLKHHVLLYADNLRIGTDGTLRGATVRIKVPSDDSFSMEEVRRLPGVRSTGDAGNEVYVDIKDIHNLREVLGGFVMDKYVTQLLDDHMRAEKRNTEASARADVITTSQILSDDGGVNTDPEKGGLLTGLRDYTPDGKRFKLASHQEEGLRFIAKAQGRALLAHFMGTGKTVTTIAAIQMMRNARTPEGTPLPGAPQKRIAIVVPLNTAQQWESAVRYYTNEPVTLIGAKSLPNSVQAFNPKNWPAEAKEEGPEAAAAAAAARDEWLKENPGGWDPVKDANTKFVIIPWQYFQQNEQDLRQHGDFDGIVIDEAHGFVKESERSRSIDSWNGSMNMMLLLTGTPITNKVDDLPRYVDLLTNGKSPLGTREEFKNRYMVGSAVLRAAGSATPAKTDINPARLPELAGRLAPYIHVAMPEDVKGKTMPAVLLDENQPAHMIGVQEQVYRLAMAAMTSEQMAKLESIGLIGADESELFGGKDGEELKKKVNIARAFANSPGYKPPDDRKFAMWEEEIKSKPDKKTGEVKITVKKHTLELPSHARLTAEPPFGFGGRWPSPKNVRRGHLALGEYAAFQHHIGQILGRDYETHYAGKKIDAKTLAQIEKGTVNGHSWGMVANPEYGPEGAISRGTIDDTGDHHGLHITFDGEEISIPTGMKFVRDPKRSAQGVYYAEGDWDWTQKFEMKVEGAEGGESEGGTPDEEEEEEKKKKGYVPLVIGGKEYDPSIQRSPFRRRERAMFDAVLTSQNAKCDEMERWIIQNTETASGGDKKQQFILFGNRVGSSCRTMESKLRSMGYMDLNEALGNEDRGYSSEADKKRVPSQGYFVTYFGKSANLGDRDLNSEIFRKVKDGSGRDTDTSMFVHRTLTGSVGKPPSIDPSTGRAEYAEGWSPAERTKIGQMFQGKDGGLEVPMRVTAKIVGGAERLMYVYESDLRAGERKLVKELEVRRTAATSLADKDKYEAQMAVIFDKHVTDRPPLTVRQMDIFNNCQIMVASDAAQVGLNWGNASKLGMYDSLHSPMQEWQRITRAARMLDAVVPDKAKPAFTALDARVRELEVVHAEKRLAMLGTSAADIAEMRASGKLTTQNAASYVEYKGLDSALPIITEAWDSLPQSVKNDAINNGFKTPNVMAEAYYANRALQRIRELRAPVGEQLRQTGRSLPPTEVPQPGGGVKVVTRMLKPVEVTTADITNEIVENHLTPFEREILRGRKYLVDVKRFTTSVNMPVFEENEVPDGEGGTKTVKVLKDPPEFIAESPSKAEFAQMIAGRAKQAPYETLLNAIQTGLAPRTNFDALAVTPASLATLSSSASAAPVIAKPKKVRLSPGPAATPPMPPEPASAWKQKQLAAVDAWRLRREAFNAKLAAGKAKRDAEYQRKLKKKRKLAAAKAAETRHARTAASMKKSEMRMPLNTFFFGHNHRGEA